MNTIASTMREQIKSAIQKYTWLTQSKFICVGKDSIGAIKNNTFYRISLETLSIGDPKTAENAKFMDYCPTLDEYFWNAHHPIKKIQYLQGENTSIIISDISWMDNFRICFTSNGKIAVASNSLALYNLDGSIDRFGISSLLVQGVKLFRANDLYFTNRGKIMRYNYDHDITMDIDMSPQTPFLVDQNGRIIYILTNGNIVIINQLSYPIINRYKLIVITSEIIIIGNSVFFI